MVTLTSAKRIVVKIGSALLVDRDTGHLRSAWLGSLATDIARVRARGTEVILVSSGAIALGREVLGLPRTGLPLEQSQAAAAVGQIRLARAYEEVLAPHGVITAQILVTLDDISDRRRYLNSRATMETLLNMGVTPIVNENDTIATDEIRYGDNDRLAAQIAVTVGADQLVLLSDVDGFYSDNPNLNPDAKRFDIIEKITPEIEDMAGDGVSGLSKGGMITKLLAARMATESGCAMVIAPGALNMPLSVIETGGACTWFLPQDDPQTARKRWISGIKPRGKVLVDEGAANALTRGKSLLPAGIMRVSGTFGRGDAVEVCSAEGHRIAVGLSRYTSDELQQVKGLRSENIEQIWGYKARSAFIHRDDMVI